MVTGTQISEETHPMRDDLTLAERKALTHIQQNGDDRNLRAKKWKAIKSALYFKGYLRRRIGDWAWILKR